MAKKSVKKLSNRDVDLLYELGTIRNISRTWVQFQVPNFANLAEHHFRVAWLAMTIAQAEGADISKVVKMALMHDIAESRTGDVHYVSRQYVVRNEELGMKDMVAGTTLEKEMLELWHEYEERKTLEAQIVKDADNLDVDMELSEQTQTGSTLEAALKPMRLTVRKERLFTDTARKLSVMIEKRSPHAWHLEGRNRINAGDWQKGR